MKAFLIREIRPHRNPFSVFVGTIQKIYLALLDGVRIIFLDEFESHVWTQGSRCTSYKRRISNFGQQENEI
jgi:hypothetical protein